MNWNENFFVIGKLAMYVRQKYKKSGAFFIFYVGEQTEPIGFNLFE